MNQKIFSLPLVWRRKSLLSHQPTHPLSHLVCQLAIKVSICKRYLWLCTFPMYRSVGREVQIIRLKLWWQLLYVHNISVFHFFFNQHHLYNKLCSNTDEGGRGSIMVGSLWGSFTGSFFESHPSNKPKEPSCESQSCQSSWVQYIQWVCGGALLPKYLSMVNLTIYRKSYGNSTSFGCFLKILVQ